MPRVIQDASVLPATRAMLGAMDVEGGPTDEQIDVLSAVVAGYWGRPDIAVGDLDRLDPSEAAQAVPDERERHRLGELMVMLEMCRHPLSQAQVDRVDDYLSVLGGPGPGQDMARDLVRYGAEVATADYFRALDERVSSLSEPSLREKYGKDLDEPDLELAGRLRSMQDLPEGTLGHEFVEFHRRNGFEMPGEETAFPAVFVAHDMCHVIGGYEPTGEGEIALGAMQLAVADNADHWIQFLANLAVHEAGFLYKEDLDIVPKPGALTRPGATDLLVEGLTRGSQCTGDFTTADHLAMAEWPLSEVRAAFGIPPRAA